MRRFNDGQAAHIVVYMTDTSEVREYTSERGFEYLLNEDRNGMIRILHHTEVNQLNTKI